MIDSMTEQQTMKAVVIRAFGPPDVLHTADVPLPLPGPDEVRVRVKAAGVQPFDLAVREKGWVPPGLNIRFPQILGNDFAGTIEQAGDYVTDFAAGDDVIGWALLASYAEYVVVPASQIVRKPPSIPWAEAGALAASGQTAHTALQELRVGEGDTVLIHGAAGGVGTMAVQLARALGATVIGTASERNHDFLRDLGANPVAYGPGLGERVRALAPGGVDVALDAAGRDALRVSVDLVPDRERIGTIVDGELAAELGVRMIRSQRSAARLTELAELCAAGKLKVRVRRTFPLEEAAAAHRELASGHGQGKVVLMIG